MPIPVSSGILGKKFVRALAAMLAVYAVLAIAFAVTLAQFRDLEPRQDHASFVQWVRGAVDTEHILPVRKPGESFRAAAERDDASLLNAVVRPIYAANIVLLKTLSLAYFYAGSEIFGASMPFQIALSIAASLAAMTIFAALPLAGTAAPRTAYVFALCGAAIACLLFNGFLHLFSALGDHNVGLLMIAAVGWAAVRLEGHLSRRPFSGAPVPARYTVPLAVAVFFATFANHTSALLAAPAVGLTILALPGLSIGRKIRAGLPAAAAFALSLVPVAALLYVSLSPGYLGSMDESFLGYIDFARNEGNASLDPIAGFASRAGHWLGGLLAIFGPLGVAAGIAGLIGMATLDRMRFPLALLLCHLIFAAGMAAFASQSSRTIAYAVPVLCLGIAWCIVRLAFLRKPHRLLAPGAALAIAAVYLAAQVPTLRDPANDAFWGSYFERQGGWSDIRTEIDAALPDGALLLPYDYNVSHLYGATRSDKPRPIHSISSATSLVSRATSGSLADYFDRRGISRDRATPLFVLAFEETSRDREETMKRIADAGSALFPAGYGGLKPIGRWRWKARDTTVALFAVLPRGPDARP